MIRAHRIDDSSTFLGQTCALCKQEFVPGDDIVICPEDGSRHHAGCWQANGNHCTAYGCRGAGEIGVAATARPQSTPARSRSVGRTRVITQEPETPRSAPGAARPIPNAPGSKVRTLPAGGIGCARTCLFLAIAIAIILFALGCFGLWSIADRLMTGSGSVPYHLSLTHELISALPLLWS